MKNKTKVILMIAALLVGTLCIAEISGKDCVPPGSVQLMAAAEEGGFELWKISGCPAWHDGIYQVKAIEFNGKLAGAIVYPGTDETKDYLTYIQLSEKIEKIASDMKMLFFGIYNFFGIPLWGK